jgi:hypothetical protein
METQPVENVFNKIRDGGKKKTIKKTEEVIENL